jgi:hypothetical protein
MELLVAFSYISLPIISESYQAWKATNTMMKVFDSQRLPHYEHDDLTYTLT